MIILARSVPGDYPRKIAVRYLFQLPDKKEKFVSIELALNINGYSAMRVMVFSAFTTNLLADLRPNLTSIKL